MVYMMKKTFIVYETDTLRPVKEYTYQKSAINYLATLGNGYSVTDKATFLAIPIPMKKVKNLMSGKEIEIPVNTPRCCDPSTELYWTM